MWVHLSVNAIVEHGGEWLFFPPAAVHWSLFASFRVVFPTHVLFHPGVTLDVYGVLWIRNSVFMGAKKKADNVY